MADFYGVLTEQSSGRRCEFTDRSEYLAALYGGGMDPTDPPPEEPTKPIELDPTPTFTGGRAPAVGTDKNARS